MHEVEEMTWSGLIETGREMIVAYIQKQEEELPRPKVIEHEGKTASAAARATHAAVCFGLRPDAVSTRRLRHAGNATSGGGAVGRETRHAGERNTSYLLQKWSGTQCVKESYQESRATLLDILGFAPSVNCLEDMAARASEHAEVYFDRTGTGRSDDGGGDPGRHERLQRRADATRSMRRGRSRATTCRDRSGNG